MSPTATSPSSRDEAARSHLAGLADCSRLRWKCSVSVTAATGALDGKEQCLVDHDRDRERAAAATATLPTTLRRQPGLHDRDRISIAGRTFTVNQGQGCGFSLSASSATVAAGGDRCLRRADVGGMRLDGGQQRDWLTVTAGAGDGDGNVRYAARQTAGHNGAGRSAPAGRRSRSRRRAGCTFSISPASQNVGSGGGDVSVAVNAPAGCPWSARAASRGSLSPPAAVVPATAPSKLTICANTDAQRRGTVTIAEHTFTIVQGSGCTFSIAPASQGVPSSGGSGRSA